MNAYKIEIHVSELNDFILSEFGYLILVENCYKSPDKTEYESFMFYPKLTKEQAENLYNLGYLISDK